MQNFNYPKTVTILDTRQYDGEWVPETLVEAISWLTEKLAKVPVQYQKDVSIRIGGDSYHDSTYATVCIEYNRPATPEEIEQRRAYAMAQAEKDAETARRNVAAAEQRAAALRLA